ncbi:hypothetical protein ACWIUD_03740 [Helicobacter sp. 23-1044]
MAIFGDSQNLKKILPLPCGGGLRGWVKSKNPSLRDESPIRAKQSKIKSDSSIRRFALQLQKFHTKSTQFYF